MISLFLNTSSSYLDVALIKNKKVIGSYYKDLGKDLSKTTLPVIKNMFDENKISSDDVDDIYVVNGPGSFTGLRVGVTIAKTYAHFKEKKIFPVSSLYAMAASVDSFDYIIPVIDARRGFVFAGIYDSNYNCILNDCYISFDELKENVNCLSNFVYVSTSKLDFVDTKIVSFNYLSIINNYKGSDVPAIGLIPSYLKKTQAEENLKND